MGSILTATVPRLGPEAEQRLRSLHEQTVTFKKLDGGKYGEVGVWESFRALTDHEWHNIQSIIGGYKLPVEIIDNGQFSFALLVHRHPEELGEKLEQLICIPMDNLPCYAKHKEESSNYDAMMDLLQAEVRDLVENEDNKSLLSFYGICTRSLSQYRY